MLRRSPALALGLHACERCDDGRQGGAHVSGLSQVLGSGWLPPQPPAEGLAEFLSFLVVQRSTLPDTPELATVPGELGQ